MAPARRSSLGFVAESTPGKRGWRIVADMGSCEAVQSHGGQIALEQLRKLARTTFERLWLFGLLSRTDVEAVMRTESLPRTAPTSAPLSYGTYVPSAANAPPSHAPTSAPLSHETYVVPTPAKATPKPTPRAPITVEKFKL